jgi:hypothetical protein
VADNEFGSGGRCDLRGGAATEDQLRALIARGERQQTQFKAAEADAADLARRIAALADSAGGTLLPCLGDDSGSRDETAARLAEVKGQ